MLSRKKRYLQVALNSSLTEARRIINSLPPSDRILVEAGTPLIKSYGAEAIRNLKTWWQEKLNEATQEPQENNAYIVADLKTMDRAVTEVDEAKIAGASAAVVLGVAPIETIDAFIKQCLSTSLDSMLDMMNVDEPYKILRKLKKLPTVVILHRSVDEETYNKDKTLPYQNIIKLKGTYDIFISVAGGDTSREVQRSVFNGADIVVVWKDFYKGALETGPLVENFLKDIR